MQNQITPEQYGKTPKIARQIMLQMAEMFGHQAAAEVYHMALSLERDPELRIFIESKLNKLKDVGIVPAPPVVIDEGAGQIMTKQELVATPSLFLLNKGNWNYLEGRTSYLASGRWWMLASSLALVIGTIYFLFLASQHLPLIILAILGFMSIAFSVFTISTFRNSARLENEGILLKGQITFINGHWETHHSTNKQGINSASYSYKVSVAAVVKKPNGTILNVTATKTRNDLGRSILPSVGTPIGIIYVDDKTYQIL